MHHCARTQALWVPDQPNSGRFLRRLCRDAKKDGLTVQVASPAAEDLERLCAPARVCCLRCHPGKGSPGRPGAPSPLWAVVRGAAKKLRAQPLS